MVATEHTSLYTEWRRRRPDFGLKELFKISAPPLEEGAAPDAIMKGPAVKGQAGNGRVVYIPEVKPAMLKPPSVSMTSEY